jgi:Ni/Co efflux regulator RcnB
MRNLLIGIFLAGAAVTPAIAQDNGNSRWHHDQQQNDRGERHQQREQAQPQQQQERPRFNGGNFYRQQQMPEQQVQSQQGQRGGWNRQGFEGRRAPDAEAQQGQRGGWNRQGFEGRRGPDAGAQQQAVNRGPLEVEQNRHGGWNRNYGSRQGEAAQQQRWQNGGWNGQRAVQQYRQGNRYASGGWNRDWRNDRRYDWRRYRDSHRSTFHLGLYIDPFGYGYQSFAVGYRLPPVYFGQQYWIDPAMYELPYPPPGTQWVRYWNDALLVDMYTGEVVDAIQGFFW